MSEPKTKKTDPFNEAIKAYLDKRAAEDELFAQSYAKEGKSIDECCRYIIQEVKKSGRQGFSDEEVFGLAVHYYDEDDLGKIGNLNCKVVVNTSIELTEEEKAAAKARAIAQYESSVKSQLSKEASKESAPAKPKKETKPKKEAPAPSSPSLFDFDMEEEDEAEN